jgi:two-component system, OmpR family, response regulator
MTAVSAQASASSAGVSAWTLSVERAGDADRRPATTVLIVDEDSTVVELLAATLAYQGFAVLGAATGPAGLDSARTLRPDVVVLEVALPGMDGFEVLRQLRADGIGAPVLFLTARTALQDKVRGLTGGGEDYITKPFSLEEVVARLRVILRRRNILGKPVTRLSFANIELDTETHEAWKAGEPVQLTPTEFAMLNYFMKNPGKALSKTNIMTNVWPSRVDGDVDVVETYVCYLRRKIDTTDPQLLHTLRGVGYVLGSTG